MALNVLIITIDSHLESHRDQIARISLLPWRPSSFSSSSSSSTSSPSASPSPPSSAAARPGSCLTRRLCTPTASTTPTSPPAPFSSSSSAKSSSWSSASASAAAAGSAPAAPAPAPSSSSSSPEACLLTGSVRNAHHTRYRSLFFNGNPSCETLRKGVVASGAAFVLFTAILSEFYYVSFSEAATDLPPYGGPEIGMTTYK